MLVTVTVAVPGAVPVMLMPLLVKPVMVSLNTTVKLTGETSVGSG